MPILKSLSILLVFFCLSANAQKSEISGTATEWAGKEIRLLIENDPITKTYREIDATSIAEDGSFKLTVDTNETLLLWISVKRFKSPIWVSPAQDYSISVIPNPENVLVDTWQNGSFQYAFLSLDSTDVNNVVADFDTQYYNFYLDNAQFIGTSQLRRNVHRFTEEFKLDSSIALIYNYQRYTLAEMKLSSGVKKSDLYNEYLNAQPLLLNNSAWYYFFNLFYADYFQAYDLKFGGATIANRLKMGLPADSIDVLFAKDDFMKYEPIRQLVILKSVSEVYSNAAYPIEKLREIVRLIAQNPSTPILGEVAGRLYAKMENTLIGSELTAISSNWEPEYISESDTLPTILMVSSEAIASEKEALVLKSLHEKYSDFVHFAELRISDVKNPVNRPWTVYHPKDKIQFLDFFNIYGFPHFIWVDGNGIIRENGIEKPSDGLETRMFRIKTDAENKNRIKIGQ